MSIFFASHETVDILMLSQCAVMIGEYYRRDNNPQKHKQRPQRTMVVSDLFA